MYPGAQESALISPPPSDSFVLCVGFLREVKGSIHNSGRPCDCSFLPCTTLLLVPQTLLRRSALPWRPVREVGSLGVDVEPQGRGSGGEPAAGVL